jgi:citrate lyase beta subunit
MKHHHDAESFGPIRIKLSRANTAFAHSFPGASPARQPVHTVYGGAQLFTAQTASRMSETSLKSLNEHAPDGDALAAALGQSKGPLWKIVHSRVAAKLKREAVEDFRIDYEDGYGNRPEAEEDGHAESVALEVAKGMKEDTLPPFIGIRIKPFNEENVQRSTRTLDIFLSTLLHATDGKLPPGFVVTLPKITITAQSTALAEMLGVIEERNELPQGTLKFELMVETTQSILGEDGRCPLRQFVEAGQGRCIGAHFGTYDYTAGCGITAAHQTMANPVCDFAKHMMQVSLAGTPIMLSDGATNIMPVGDRDAVHRAWRLSYSHIRHSLETGFYQGWDLHPAQLPVRYAAVYAFFLESLEAASQRLKGFVEKAAKATLLGEVFDDAATGQGLLNFFLRGIACGAITEDEARATGLSIEEIRGRSFLKIIEGRKLKTP